METILGALGALAIAGILSMPRAAGAHDPAAEAGSRTLSATSHVEDARRGEWPPYPVPQVLVGTHFHTEHHRVYHARGRYASPWAFGSGTAGYGTPPHGTGGFWPPVIVDTR